MLGFQFSKYIPNKVDGSNFENLLDLFKQLLLHTSGDMTEALDWMNELDKQHNITNSEYGMGDFIQDLKDKGYMDENKRTGEYETTSKMEQAIRKNALQEVFGKLKKSGKGNHKTRFIGIGDESTADMRGYQFGDSLDQIALTESIKNAQFNHGANEMMTHDDLVINEKTYKTQTSTVLMIDISHSMILYGEDRITPAKRVALALAEYIKTQFPKDTLDIIVFGNDAWQITLKDLPYLKVGPYHTNTVAGLQLAREILRRKRNPNKQIFMITDGKPSCLKEGIKYYKNSFGLDKKIVNKCYNEAAACRRLGIPITTFMIAQDPYLQQFVEEFTETNNGKAFYTGLQGLGEIVFTDYAKNKRKRM
ncbi:VWA domain-containing protein [Bacteroidia bacterium]|nr:VWA domain-containing protein [Bacteroidota bacterium]MDA8930168.1 VWA domain-containing protein [Bacteroidia bacterium]MDB4174511.1 VWA domain-containing protein [Bacteroidia bacterium]